MHNKYSLQVAYLAHMTPEEKKEYNKRYYQEHKEEYWGVKGDGAWTRKSDNGMKVYTPAGSWTSSSGKVIPTYKQLTTNQIKGRSVPDTAKDFHQKWDARLTNYANRLRVSTALTNPVAAAKALTGDTFDYKIAVAKRITSDLFSRNGAKTIAELAGDAGRVAINKGKSIVSNFVSLWKSGVRR